MAKILVIDDSWLTRRGIIGILQEDGYELIEASNGKDGLEMVEEYRPDCILLDLLMPELNGFGVLKKLEEKNSRTPVIMLSAGIQDTVRAKAFKMGAFELLNKPPQPEILCTTVNNALLP